jgi:predicted ATPase
MAWTFARTARRDADVSQRRPLPDFDLAPQQRRDRTIEALVQGIVRAERDLPKRVIFEDVHWIDPTSLEMLSRAIDSVGERRILMILTFRPEFEAPWVGRSGVTTLTANRLALADILRMIDRVVGERSLPANIRRDIVERADGIPLHVEEITKAVMESDTEREARRTVAAIPSPSLTVPASLHASLMARLDRLGAAKEVAQMGAAIGREFSHRLLDAVACKPGNDLGSSLDALVAAGLLFRQGVPPHATEPLRGTARNRAYSAGWAR